MISPCRRDDEMMSISRHGTFYLTQTFSARHRNIVPLKELPLIAAD